MKNLVRKSIFAAFCLFLLPAAALADGVVSGPCGGENVVGFQSQLFGPCTTSGGAVVSYQAIVIGVDNAFRLTLVPFDVMTGAGQTNVFGISALSFPVFDNTGRPVPSSLSLDVMVSILEPGASVDLTLTGSVGSDIIITRHIVDSGHVIVFTVADLAVSNVAQMSLIFSINGAVSLTGGQAQFLGILPELPEPTTLILLGTGLAGIAMKTRKRLRRDRK